MHDAFNGQGWPLTQGHLAGLYRIIWEDGLEGNYCSSCWGGNTNAKATIQGRIDIELDMQQESDKHWQLRKLCDMFPESFPTLAS